MAEAEWEMLTLLLASDSSTSILLLFLLVVRTLRLDEARETVTREDGLGVSLSLNQRTQDTHKPHFLHFFFLNLELYNFFPIPFSSQRFI